MTCLHDKANEIKSQQHAYDQVTEWTKFTTCDQMLACLHSLRWKSFCALIIFCWRNINAIIFRSTQIGSKYFIIAPPEMVIYTEIREWLINNIARQVLPDGQWELGCHAFDTLLSLWKWTLNTGDFPTGDKYPYPTSDNTCRGPKIMKQSTAHVHHTLYIVKNLSTHKLTYILYILYITSVSHTSITSQWTVHVAVKPCP